MAETVRNLMITLYECPHCGYLTFPSGEEEEHGPPECSHGLLFGLDPCGGGESEMQKVQFERKS